ncbi:hypothetical protein KIN20_036216 [Parelaphostrongylus tenuis]|uniref:Uncharacterized protein n=1 Tax=Parelaphostrongylus tenuis TaxID=148309 RepID=A0AAD5RCV2_PARTN|nr:hypothetical protein KIN20_036216 [Parelaphostrongylus tenuis]
MAEICIIGQFGSLYRCSVSSFCYQISSFVHHISKFAFFLTRAFHFVDCVCEFFTWLIWHRLAARVNTPRTPNGSTLMSCRMQADENLPHIDQQRTGLDYSSYYNYLLQNPWIQKVIATYDWTKHRSKLLESALDSVESRVSTVAHSATRRVLDAHQNYIIRPREAVSSVYTAGVEKTKSVMETSKYVVVQGGTFGIGAAVVATQLSLALSSGCALLFINSVGEVQKTGQEFLNSILNAEKAVEQKIWAAVEEGMRVAKIPVDKVTEGTNIFLDIASVLVERSFGIVIEENADSSVKQRVSLLSRKIVDAFNNQAHSKVIDPVTAPLRVLLDQLRKSFVLVDYVRDKGEWALEKVGGLSSSVYDLKTRIESEAKEYSTRPEELLMRTIQSTSSQLSENLQALKDKQIFGDGTKVESFIAYLHELDTNLGESNNIYEVRDEVLSEATQRFSEVSTWISNLLNGEKQSSD